MAALIGGVNSQKNPASVPAGNSTSEAAAARALAATNARMSLMVIDIGL